MTPLPAAAGVTVVHLSPLDLAGAEISGLKPLPFALGLLEGTGELVSPVIEAELPFDDLVGSWNARVPAGGSVEMQVKVRWGGRWSAWYRLASWSPAAPKSPGRQEDKNGFVDVDTLRLKRKADAFRYRVRLRSPKGRAVRLSRVAVTYEDSSRTPPPPAPFVPPVFPLPG